MDLSMIHKSPSAYVDRAHDERNRENALGRRFYRRRFREWQTQADREYHLSVLRSFPNSDSLECGGIELNEPFH